MSVFSCSKSLDNSEETLPQKKVNANIPANFASSKVVADGGAATFSTSEKVYVYNNTTSHLDTEYLSPEVDGTTSNLKGSLSGTYSKGDNLKLLYNTTSEGIADYTNQDGTLENVVDAATATVKIASVEGDSFTTRTAYFDNLQSIFKFTFKDQDNNPVKVKWLNILSEYNKLQSSYNLIEDTVTYGGVGVVCNKALSTVYLALRFTSNPSEIIVFSVIDENGIVYVGSKNAPATGFKYGRFYSSTIELTKYKYKDPTVSGDTIQYAPGNLFLKDGKYKFRAPYYSLKIKDLSDYFTYDECQSFLIANGGENIEIEGTTGWYMGSILSSQKRAVRLNTYYNEEQGFLLVPIDISDEILSEFSNNRTTTEVNLCYYLAKGMVFVPVTYGYIKTDGQTRNYDNEHWWFYRSNPMRKPYGYSIYNGYSVEPTYTVPDAGGAAVRLVRKYK